METGLRTVNIGAGPDGAMCASVVRRQGIEVVVYDANGDAGSALGDVGRRVRVRSARSMHGRLEGSSGKTREPSRRVRHVHRKDTQEE